MEKATAVEKELLKDICGKLGSDFNPKRFIPFVILHEFEGLLFSDCAAFGRVIGQPGLENKFQAIRDQFSSPEEINDSPVTAPSKRVGQLISGYQKPLFGILTILEIGLDKIRKECPHFSNWITCLESRINN